MRKWTRKAVKDALAALLVGALLWVPYQDALAQKAPGGVGVGIVLEDPTSIESPVIAISREFTGGQYYYLETSTPSFTPVLLYQGAGFLLEVSASSGTVNTAMSYCQAFSSNTPSGITATTQGKALSPEVFTVNFSSVANSAPFGASTYPASETGTWQPKTPTYFPNGLVGIKTDTAANCRYKIALATATLAGQ